MRAPRQLLSCGNKWRRRQILREAAERSIREEELVRRDLEELADLLPYAGIVTSLFATESSDGEGQQG